jgi:dTDP-4-dehydrorhamnose reductase
MKKLFITGATGMVGSNVSVFLRDKYKVYAGTTKEIKIRGCEMIFADITDRKKILEIFKKICPDYVLHLAALTDISLCEKNKKLAKKINIEGTKNIVFASEEIGARLIFASTNYVFNGKKGMYSEKDKTNPVNFYSQTKLEAEKEILKYKNSVVIRITPFGWNLFEKSSFLSSIIETLEKERPFNAFTDQFFSPLSTYDLSKILIKIFESDITGILNIAGQEKMSKFEFSEKVSEVFNLDPKMINPIKLNDLGDSVERPKDTSLDISKAKSLFGDIFPPVSIGLEKMKQVRNEGFL